MAFVNMHIFFSDIIHFDMSILLLTVTLRGYLISIAYCLFFHFSVSLSFTVRLDFLISLDM